LNQEKGTILIGAVTIILFLIGVTLITLGLASIFGTAVGIIALGAILIIAGFITGNS
jgi:hypothetical protein